MPYVALYRKFRPPTFEDVKGQDHIVTTLKNQIISDRVGHAYLFCGTRGTGKTSVAKILSRAVNCEHPVDGNPCGECETCRAIAEGRCVDVVEIDAASNNGVDNIRTIIDEVSYSPTMGKKKVYIIDEVHMLSTGAFNALLKTLEEPPEYVLFILATTEVQKIPITILSRCQRYDFHRITIDTIEDRLKEVTDRESIKAQEKALRYIARAADGSMRDSLSLLDQCVAFNYGQELTYDKVLGVLGAVDTAVFGQMFKALTQSDAKEALSILADVVIQGRELSQFVADFVWYLRNLMLVTTSDNVEDVVDISSDNLEVLKNQAQATDIDTIMHFISVFSELEASLRFAAQKRILIEMALIRICRPQMEGTTDEGLAQRVRALENKARESADIIDRIRNGQIAVTNAASSGASLEAPKPVAARKLDKPIPEDIKAVVDGFDRFLGGMKDAALKNFMKTDRPRLSLGADNTLQMVFNNQVTMGIIEAQKKYLEQELADAFGKDIKVEIRALAKGEQFEESYIDLEAIKSAIQFDVVTEDEVNRPVEDTISKDNVSDGASDSQPTGGVSDSIKESQPMDTVPGDVSESQPMDAVSDDLNESQAVDEVSGDISDMHDADYGFMTESLQNLSPEDDGNSFEEKDEPEDEA